MECIRGFSNEWRFLSNFYLAEVEYEGIRYPSSENAYQAAKFLNLETRAKFINITPGQAKRLSRKFIIRPDWEEVRISIMHEICMDKFTRHPDLAQMLLNTGDMYIEETNTWGDKFWGVCDGIGENWLGRILMNIRSTF